MEVSDLHQVLPSVKVENEWDWIDHDRGFPTVQTSNGESKPLGTELRSFKESLSHSVFHDPGNGAYEYNTLNEGQGQIRLLTIQPGSFDDPITCCLSTVSLSSNLFFEALSYSWGDPKITREIHVDGNI
jgi:hypothetical protein